MRFVLDPELLGNGRGDWHFVIRSALKFRKSQRDRLDGRPFLLDGQPGENRRVVAGREKNTDGHIRDQMAPHAVGQSVTQNLVPTRDLMRPGILCPAEFIRYVKEPRRRDASPARYAHMCAGRQRSYIA